MIETIRKSISGKALIIIGVVLSMLIWGISWPSAKVLTRYGPPTEIAFIRFIFTFIGLFAILFFAKTPLKINKKGYGYLLGASILIAVYSLLFFSGVKYGMPGAGGVLVTTMTPIVAYMLALSIQKRKPSILETIGLSIGTIAGFILLRLWNHWQEILQSGNLFFLASVLLWVFLSRITAISHKYGSPLAFSLWMYFLCIFCLAIMVDFHVVLNILKNGDTIFWLNIVFNGIMNTGMATTFFFFATSRLGAERTSSFIYIVPFAAAFSSWFAIGELIAVHTIIGGLLGLLAIWIIHFKKIANAVNKTKE